jgi:hypothetical protein
LCAFVALSLKVVIVSLFYFFSYSSLQFNRLIAVIFLFSFQLAWPPFWNFFFFFKGSASFCSD